MPSPSSTLTTDYISGCQTSGCGGGCGCPNGGCSGGDGCDCGTDCGTGTVSLERTPLATPHGHFCYSFFNRFTQAGSPANPNLGMGTNFLPDDWAFATTSASNEWGFIWGPNRAHWFDATSLQGKYGTRYLISVLPSGNFWLNDPDSGMVYEFDAATGLLLSTTTPGGQQTVNTITSGQITQAVRSFTYTQCGVSLTTTEVRRFDYYPSGSGASSGLLQYVTLLRPNDTAAAIRRIAFTYYDADGNPGDLKTVSVQVLQGTSWVTVSTEYYRYYTANSDGTPNTPPGYVHGLKFVVGPEAFARLSREADPFTAPDAVVARYADVYYEYTALEEGVNTRRVTRGVTGAGTHTHLFTYQDAPSGQPVGYNNWQLKATCDRDDGSQKITFTNYVRQTLLTDLWDTPGDQAAGRWVTYTTYHPTCDCPAACYSPSAINMYASYVYDPTSPDLAVMLNATVGLVNITTYAGTGVTGCYPQSEQVQQGAAGTPITVRQYTYSTQTVGTSPQQTTIVLRAAVTEFQSDSGGGSNPTTTTYSYTFFTTPTATVQVQTKTTTQPQIPTSQNGPGDNPTSDPLNITVETFDIQGRSIQSTDPYDIHNPPSYIPSVTNSYDEPTGALIQSVTNPYSGTPPSTSEYNLVTDFQVDGLGRTTQSLEPTVNVNGQLVRKAEWTVYQDVLHEVWSAAGFATGSNSGPLYLFTLVNPVSITKMDLAGRTTDQISAIRECTAGALGASDSFPQSSWVRWTHNRFENAGDQTGTRVYHDIPRDCEGHPGKNFNETTYGYDRMGRQNMVRSPGGTIIRTVFDVRNNSLSVYVGTADLGATDEAPDGFSAPGNNMVPVEINIYDGGDPVGGDGLLTTTLLPVDGTSANDRRTDYAYDFRDRQTSVITFIVPTGSVRSVITVKTLDNLDRIVQVDEYDTTVADANRIRRSQMLYDNLGRVYQTLVYAVPITGGSAGTPSTPQISNTWFNAQGQVVKGQPAGAQSYAKTQYDEVSRVSGTFTGYAAAGEDPWSVGSGDHILEQVLLTYDLASNVIQTVAFQRNQGATSAVGQLTSANARVSYSGEWFDGVGRSIAAADYGTASFDRSIVTSPPASSSVVQVTATAYNNRGEAFETTDPKGAVARTQYDDVGRVARWIQNYEKEASAGPGANVTTEVSYAPDGGIATLTAVNPATGNQTTRFLYGTTLTGGNAIARSDLLAAVVYPNATDGTDQLTFQYNLQSQIQQMQDRNSNIHNYAFDGLGRTASDAVKTLGTGVDGRVLRIDLAYEIRDMVSQITSYSDIAGTTAVNQVTLTYNQFEQLITDAQNHSGAGGTPPAVNYGYADGTANTIRLTSITYPNGRVLNIDYATGTEDDILSRVTDLTIAGEATAAVQYQYFGLNSFATVTYPMPSSVNVQSVLASGSSYPGLDQIGRIVNLPWSKTLPGDLVNLAYGYDQNNNRTYRQDVKAGPSNEQDQIYGNDALNRLVAFRQGGLEVEEPAYFLTSLVFAQDWSLDPTGNWSGFSRFDANDTNNGLDQQRTHNSFNEITAIAQTVGTPWATPTYDRNGNTTTFPDPANLATGYPAKYDGWNRMVGVTTSDATPVVAYQYDGLNRRIVLESYSSGTLTETRHLYYSDQWQVLEEDVAPSTAAERQYVWGMRYVDDCVLRDRATTGSGTFNERLYALQDANWNVVAICDNTGTVQERYAYTPYGTVSFLTPAWTPEIASSFDWVYLFQSGRLAGTTELIHFRNRDLNPLLGRWLEPDPIGFSAGDLNLVRFVANNPINNSDPWGFGLVHWGDIVKDKGWTGQEHHWFTRQTGQKAVDAICPPKGFIPINRFTTELYNSKKGSPHYTLTHGDPPILHRYQDEYQAVLATSRNCCAFLLKMIKLITTSFAHLKVKFARNMEPISPGGFFELHQKDGNKAASTIPELVEKMLEVCKRCKIRVPVITNVPSYLEQLVEAAEKQEWVEIIKQQQQRVPRPYIPPARGLDSDPLPIVGIAVAGVLIPVGWLGTGISWLGKKAIDALAPAGKIPVGVP